MSDQPDHPHGQAFDPHDPRSPTQGPLPGQPGAPVGILPRVSVVIHGGDALPPSHAVRAIVELTPLDVAAAKAAVLAASTRGHAALLITHRERAELYQEQLSARGLAVTLAPGA